MISLSSSGMSLKLKTTVPLSWVLLVVVALTVFGASDSLKVQLSLTEPSEHSCHRTLTTGILQTIFTILLRCVSHLADPVVMTEICRIFQKNRKALLKVFICLYVHCKIPADDVS